MQKVAGSNPAGSTKFKDHMNGFEDVTIGVSSFLRPGYLAKCLNSIQMYLPACKVIVADDSDSPISVPSHMKLIGLPFDSGLPAKRNVSVQACQTEYWLCGCDDFNHGTPDSWTGLASMIQILDEHPEYSVVGGRVDNNPYEGMLDWVPGSHIKETRLKYNGDKFQRCDLTVNYFLARTKDIRDIPWDERMKIGGEHGDWFLELKLQGKKVAWAKDVNITTWPYNASWEDPRYTNFRRRAVGLGHRIFMEKRDIKQYIGFSE